MKTIVEYKGKTVYRKCACGETAFDARFALTSSDFSPLSQTPVNFFYYACRNCSKLANFRK